MRFFVGFDDTDTLDAGRGTGKLARWFEAALPGECRCCGVIRHQLLVHPSIPYTSHNSSACVVVEAPDASLRKALVEAAASHLAAHFIEGSDPGLCVAAEADAALPALVEHGLACTRRVVTKAEAFSAAGESHLSGHGGTDEGLIGAAAAVGLTAWGWSGRFIAWGSLRDLGTETTVSVLRGEGVHVVSLDRDGGVPDLDDRVLTGDWIRPRLWAGRPVLPLVPLEKGAWQVLDSKERKDPDRQAKTRGTSIGPARRRL